MFKGAYLEHEGHLSPRLREVLRKLRLRAFATAPGILVGREAELCEHFGCSPSMLRQAARQMEVQGLLLIRRGVQGGYFSSRPTSRPIIDMMAFYMMSQGVSLREVFAGAMPSVRAAVDMAAACPAGSAAHERINALIERLSVRFPEDTSVEDFIDEESEIDDAMFQAAGNLPLTLYVKALNRYARERFGARMFDREPHRRIVYRRVRLAMLKALINGDAAGAHKSVDQALAMVDEWLDAAFLDAAIAPIV